MTPDPATPDPATPGPATPGPATGPVAAPAAADASEAVAELGPGHAGLAAALRELWAYRDLLWFWTARNVRIRYAQSALGVGWAVIQPLFAMLVFTVVFGGLAGMESDGAPYALFSFVALVPWTFFANAVTDGTGSLVDNANTISKVYFPRAILPLAAVAAKGLDLGIASCVLLALLAWYGVTPPLGVGLLTLPLLLGVLLVFSAAVALCLSAVAVQYRDVKYGIGFAVQLAMYAAPVVYPLSLVPERWRTLYALNPVVGVIEGLRAALLGSGPVPWALIGVGAGSSVILFAAATAFFHRRERVFADVA